MFTPRYGVIHSSPTDNSQLVWTLAHKKCSGC
ncbi:hypothetical protein MPLSOD_90218 [Mesorhizobium sp. SOD10]|nr:hypothetical protein MPLSOD_90218 [Mesorhizobium sp. SOD10]